MPSLQDEVESLSRGEIAEIADRLVKTAAEQRRTKALEKTSAGGFGESVANFIKTNPGLLAGTLAGGLGGGALGGVLTQPDAEGKYKGRTRNILGGALAGAGLGAGFGYGLNRFGQVAGPASGDHGVTGKTLQQLNSLPGDLVERGRQGFDQIKKGLDPATGEKNPWRFFLRQYANQYPLITSMLFADAGLHGAASVAGATRLGPMQIPTGRVSDLIRGAEKVIEELGESKNLSVESKSLLDVAQKIRGMSGTHRVDLQQAIAEARGGWKPRLTGKNPITAQTVSPIKVPQFATKPAIPGGTPAIPGATPAQLGAISAKGQAFAPLPGISEAVDLGAWLKSFIPGAKPANRLAFSGYVGGPGRGGAVKPVTGRWGSILRGLSSADVSRPLPYPWLTRTAPRIGLYAGLPLLAQAGGEYFGSKLDASSKANLVRDLMADAAKRK